MSDRSFPQLAFVVTMNEIEPRLKKHKLTYEDLTPYLETLKHLVMLEFDKSLTRKEHRLILDGIFERIKNGNCLPKSTQPVDPTC
jgi:hypothetical protein